MNLLKIYFFIDLIELLKLKNNFLCIFCIIYNRQTNFSHNNFDYLSFVLYFIFVFCRSKKIHEMLKLIMDTKYDDIYLFIILY